MPIDPARIEDLLARCDREDSSGVPPDRRFLYTDEIRQLLGVQPRDPDPYKALAEEIERSRRDATGTT